MNASEPDWHWWLLAVPLASILYDLLAGAALRHWLRECPSVEKKPGERITFFRPLKRGVPRLREKLETLIALAGVGGDQVLLGVDEGSEEEAICEALRGVHPDGDIAVVRCRPGVAVNPKISKLMQMEAQARHGAWLLSDSEVMFSPEFLEGFRAEWQARECAALTAPYRFANPVSWPQRCDSMGLLLGLWPGLMLVQRHGRLNFTMGACTLVRREALAEVGGWKRFGEGLAEDHELGVALTKAGGSVCLSRELVSLDSDPLTWSDYWRHQRRVAVTYRAANPAGFAGVLLTFGPVWSLACLLVFPREPIFLVALIFTAISRAANIRAMAGALKFPVPALGVTLWIASGVEVSNAPQSPRPCDRMSPLALVAR